MREFGKPVVVSMGNIAASGGYYIAAPATKILAEPGTITGSIGVVFGKFNIGSLLRDYGIQPEVIAEGQNADSVSPYSSFSKEQVRHRHTHPHTHTHTHTHTHSDTHTHTDAACIHQNKSKKVYCHLSMQYKLPFSPLIISSNHSS